MTSTGPFRGMYALTSRMVLILALIWQGALPVAAGPVSGSVVTAVICGADGPREITIDLSSGEPVQETYRSHCSDCTVCNLAVIHGALPSVALIRAGLSIQRRAGEAREGAHRLKRAGYVPRAPPPGIA